MMADANLKELAHQQQMIHLAQAHSQALKLLIEGQQKIKLSVNDALSYLETVKMKLNPLQYNEFRETMDQCKNQNWNMGDTLSKICQLFQGHPELIQGFGMFLPPNINLYLQTSGKAYSETLKHEHNFSFAATTTGNTGSENIDPTEKAKDCMSTGVETNETNDVEMKSDSELSSNEEELNQEKQFVQYKVDNNFAVLFLKKVKDRFADNPCVFEKFLQLLNSVRRNYTGPQTSIENEVFVQTSDLFQDHDDLIEEFKVFVPHAECTQISKNGMNLDGEKSDKSVESLKNPDSTLCEPTSDLVKRSYTCDPTMAAVFKYGSYEEHYFFDKVRIALDHTEVYDNFLHCLSLYNEDIVTRSEILQLAASFIGNFPDLLKEFRDLLGFKESGDNIECIPMKIIALENIKLDSETSSDIDYSTGGRNGASYRALPKNQEQPKCSGRTALCKEVLNDIWVSFPSWSEDSTFVTSCKTQYEETIYRCEDERFELDMAIESNAYTIQVLENVQKKIFKMTSEEKSAFALDDTLGGTSTVLHQRALHRIYGDKTDELVEGLKRNPVIAVPIILKRLRAKEEEWREKQSQFNVTWREQIDSFYLKSLDHKGIHFKQNDSKCFRSKTLLNEMEIVYMERKEGCGINSSGAHFVQEYKEMCVFDDAVVLICQYLKKLPGIYREDRRRIERMIRGFIPDFYGIPHEPLSDDEIEDDEEDDDVELEEPAEMEVENDQQSGHTSPSGSGVFCREDGDADADGDGDGDSDQDESNSVEENDMSDDMDKKSFVEENEMLDKIESLPHTDLPYTLFFVNKNWYIFFRQMYIFCDRLCKLLYDSAKMNFDLCKNEIDGNGDSKEFVGDLKSTYLRLIEKLSQLLTGGLDSAQFEEEARNLFGVQAYVSFTMDKLILNIVRQLQQIVTDDVCKQCTSFFVQHTRTVAAGEYTSGLEVSHIESEYLKKMEKMMGEENTFKVLWHKKELTLTIELLEPEFDVTEDPCEVERQSNYLEQYITEDSTAEDVISGNVSPVFLPRNLRRQIQYWEKKVAITDELWKERYSESFINSHPPMFARRKRKRSSSSATSSKVARLSPEENESNTKESETRRGTSPGENVAHNCDDTNVLPEAESSEMAETALELISTTVNINMNEADDANNTKIDEKQKDKVEDHSVPQDDMASESESVLEVMGEDANTEPEKSVDEDEELEQSAVEDQEEQSVVEDQETETSTAEDREKETSTDEDQEKAKYTDEDQGNEKYTDEDQEKGTSTAEEQEVDQSASKDQELDQSSAEDHELDQSAMDDQELNLSATEDQDLDESAAANQEKEESAGQEKEDSADEDKEKETVVDKGLKGTDDSDQSELDFEPETDEEEMEVLDSDTALKSEHSEESASDEEVHDVTLKADSDGEELSDKQIDVDVVKSSSTSVSSIDLENCNEGDGSEFNFDDSSDDDNQSNMSPTADSESDYDQQQDSDSGASSKSQYEYTKEEIDNVAFPKERTDSQKSFKEREKLDLAEGCDIDIDYEYFSQLSLEEKCSFLAIESLVFHDNTECSFQRSSYKMDYVWNSGMVLYRKLSFLKSRQIHYQVSEVKTTKFNFWHRIWLERYVTPAMLKSCVGWLRRGDIDTYKVVVTKINIPSEPPYFTYNKYKVRYYKVARVEK